MACLAARCPATTLPWGTPFPFVSASPNRRKARPNKGTQDERSGGQRDRTGQEIRRATRVVDGVDIAVPRGAIYGVLGPNGAGKTTTLRMLLGIIEPDGGHRTLLGHDRPREASDRVGYLPEERGLYPAMKARDAIAFHGRACAGSTWQDRARARGRPCSRRPGSAMRSTPRSASSPRAWRSSCNCSARSSTGPICWCSTNPFPGSIRSTRNGSRR